MAETKRLDVGQALDKLRGIDAPSSKITQLDNKIGALDEEMRRTRAASRRVELDQRAAAPVPVPQAKDVAAGRSGRLWVWGITIGVSVVAIVLAWMWLS